MLRWKPPALVEQSAAAAQSMREQADQLAQAVAVFKVSAVMHQRPMQDITPRSSPAPQLGSQPRPAISLSLAATPAKAKAKTAALTARKTLALAPARPVAPKAPTKSHESDWETF